jgi:Tol biopolymer transport system component
MGRAGLYRWVLACAPSLCIACGHDSTGPGADALTVALTAPSPGLVQGTITLQADAKDPRHVAGVQFLIDASDLGPEITTPPYSTQWSTDESTVGAHQLSARARDDAGNLATAAAVSVTIKLGSEIVFEDTVSSANPEIYVVNTDGSGRRRLTHHDGIDERPQWTVGGERIVFHAAGRESDGADGLYTMKPDGSDVRLLLKNPPGNQHRLSPDGRHIALATTHLVVRTDFAGELDVMNADGSGVTALANFDTVPCLVGCLTINGLAWSPDGTRLAFGTSIFGHGGSTYRQLYVVNSDGTGLHQVATDAAEPAWSPDGRYIAYSVMSSSIIPQPVNLAILGIGQVTSESSPDVPNFSPSWSPDGHRLAFNRARNISVINVDGTGLHPVTPGSFPAWNPAGATSP